MEKLTGFYLNLRPIYHTILFEIKLNIKKFYLFSIFTITFLILTNYLPWLTDMQNLPPTPSGFYMLTLNYFLLILVFVSSLFYSGIICSDYSKKIGLNLFPLIKKSHLFIGKYVAYLILVFGIVSIQFISITLLGYYFYGPPILNAIFLSFGFAILYILALASLISFISSLSSSELPVIIIVNGLILIGFSIIDQIMMSIFRVEPIYSYTYLYNIIRFIIYPDFSAMQRYVPETGLWFFPTIEQAVISLLLYGILFFIIAYIIYKRRQF
jgi:ABC-type transport system involved in multi-copper enzyme maturation permease subunit